MNPGQLSSMILEHGKEIIQLREMIKSDQRRIDNLEQLSISINEMAKSSTAVATEVKLLREKFDKTESMQKDQDKVRGERLGAIERDMQRICAIKDDIDDIKKDIDILKGEVDNLRMEPGKKWKTLVTAVLGALTALFMGYLFGNYM